MPSVLEKLYAELERARARLAVFDKLLQGLVPVLEADSQAEIEQAISDGKLVAGLQVLFEQQEALEAIQSMFPCSVCGKPMQWSPDDDMAKALTQAVASWAHSDCLKKKKGASS